MTPEIEALIECESQWNPDAINKNDIHYNSDGTISVGSFGILQYSEATFQEFCVNKYHLRDDLLDPFIQIRCAKKMISEGYGNRWSCW
jgi:hypothetical protein